MIYKRNEEDISNNAKENKIKFERFLDDINKKNEQENKVNEKNEGFINGSNMIPLDPIIETVKSICKIKTLEYSVSGFFIKLEKREEDFLCLMTNEHIITKKMIEEKATIKVYYDNQKRKKNKIRPI